MSNTNWQLKETDQFAPNCGACPGDGSICKTSCKVAEESPPVATDAKQEVNTQDAPNIQALLRLTAERISTVGPKTLAMHLNCAAGHIEAQQQRIEALERELAEAGKDAGRINWLQESEADAIYLDDGRIVDVAGGDIRKCIDAAMKEQA